MALSLSPNTTRSISSPEPAILLDCARNRDLWARLKAHQKNGQISLAVETCSFQPQSPTHAQNQTGTRISWFRFWIRPEPMRFPTAGQGDAGSGDEIATRWSHSRPQSPPFLLVTWSAKRRALDAATTILVPRATCFICAVTFRRPRDQKKRRALGTRMSHYRMSEIF